MQWKISFSTYRKNRKYNEKLCDEQIQYVCFLMYQRDTNSSQVLSLSCVTFLTRYHRHNDMKHNFRKQHHEKNYFFFFSIILSENVQKATKTQ